MLGSQGKGRLKNRVGVKKTVWGSKKMGPCGFDSGTRITKSLGYVQQPRYWLTRQDWKEVARPQKHTPATWGPLGILGAPSAYFTARLGLLLPGPEGAPKTGEKPVQIDQRGPFQACPRTVATEHFFGLLCYIIDTKAM